ncbi:hypothetical protein HNQ35_001396 [Cerasibacillus quisquiliarum]|uniref:Uncharacterized protein n=1 Tax=Cerasibacillus quisquiliarum TaxID=227865 RepID=A0A511UWB3_9BACI|nr:hypothetical protein [Cerasibacillus quisquiliarum]GEN30930.1 hypothetical protein CQU01_11680 [Cerasibacillus quisquiliarum]
MEDNHKQMLNCLVQVHQTLSICSKCYELIGRTFQWEVPFNKKTPDKGSTILPMYALSSVLLQKPAFS